MLDSPTSRGLRSQRPLAVFCWLFLLGGITALANDEQPDIYRGEIRPLLTRHCGHCHSGAEAEAEVDLKGFTDVRSVIEDRATWKRIRDMLQAHAMPPEDEPPLASEDREKLTKWISAMLAQPDPSGRRDPGKIVFRRLNRVEYNNTVLELMRLPRLFVRNYDPSEGAPREPIRVSRKNPLPIYLPVDDSDYGFDNIGEVLTLPPFLMEQYLSTAHHIVALTSGSAPENTNNSSRSTDVLTRGSWLFKPLSSGADPYEEAEQRLGEFLYRAFRHPVDAEQFQPYLDLFRQVYEEDEDFVEAMKLPVQAGLVSPHFLFRVEGDSNEPPGQIVRVPDYELASRLSYFLWSTMPDDQLLRLAGVGRLHDADVLEEQVRRMLKDKRAMGLSDNFASQWLQIEAVSAAMPDPEMFPLFDEQRGHMLLNYMEDEARFLFETVMFEDRSILDFITADYAYLNERLAKHYGVYDEKFHPKKASDRHFVRYQLDDPRRGGVLALASVHTVTSQSSRTSPVARGKWVLEAVLGAPTPPPPPGVPELDEAAPESEDLSLREKLALHRENSACASCHNRMDPFGLALENYDPIGQWRENDGAGPIDIATRLPSGEELRGPVDLKRYILEKRKADFVRCLTEQMLTYALGRPLEYYDAPAVEHITSELEKNDYRFSTLVWEIVKSYPFQYRRTQEPQNDS